MFENIIDDLVVKTKENNLNLKDILSYLFANQELGEKYSSEIRRSTIVGQIANKVLKKAKIKQNCKIMAIGDIGYFGKNKKNWSKLIKKSLGSIDVSKLEGYDLSALGSKKFRESACKYMNNYYNYDNLEKKQIIDSIIPTYGCTDGFTTIIDSIKSKHKKIKFIYPEASFLANVKIAEQILGKRNLIRIDKPRVNNFFFSEQQIDELYKSHTNDKNTNIYYITPVGNPTGSKISDFIFLKIIKKILSLDKNAIFVFDNVYIGLLKQEVSTKMFNKIFNSENILNRIIFAESLSKTLGTTGLRIGWVWSINNFFSTELKKINNYKKAGYSKILDQFTINLLSKNKKIIKFQNNAFDHWTNQREKFYTHIREKYSKLFTFTSSCDCNCNEGIYLLLKVRPGYTKEDIFSETGIIGVGIELSDGLYIRYAFGNVDYF